MRPDDMLLLGLLVAGFIAFNLFMQRLARRTREQQGRQAEVERAAAQPPAMRRGADDALADPSWGRAPPPAPTAAPLRARRPAHWRPRSQQDLRQAVVAMTVLGPCRALDPHRWR